VRGVRGSPGGSSPRDATIGFIGWASSPDPGCPADFGAVRAGNAIPISYVELDLSADRLPVGALRLLRLVGRVYGRAGKAVRCDLPDVKFTPIWSIR